jgi:hypothetical protein
MQKTILTIIGISLIGASTVQIATATERHHVGKAERAPITQQVRNANDAATWPFNPQPGWNSGYVDGHALSAPAGR